MPVTSSASPATEPPPSLTAAGVLRLGALAGAAGGIALALFLRLVGEGPIGDAIAIEAAGAHEGTAHEELFTRATQQLGGMIGAALYGACLGIVLAVVFAAVRHRLAGPDWRRAIWLAAAGFVTVNLVPFLKYPGNPPAVGDPETVGRRTLLFLVMIAWSVIATWSAWRMHRWLTERELRPPVQAAAATALYLVLIGLAYVLLPANDDPVSVPATLVWQFRVTSLGGTALCWAVLGLTLAVLLDRLSATRRGRWGS